MKKAEKLWEEIDRIDDRYLTEAMEYRSKHKLRRRYFFIGAGVAAAVLLLFVVRFLTFRKTPVEVYASDQDLRITKEKIALHTGKINDNGSMSKGSLSFYVTGEEIEKIRFSCRNQYIEGIDATEKRENYGYSENFTFEYGKNEEEYQFIYILWEPRKLCDTLRDDHDLKVSDLPEEEREDIIVMQITFLDGKETTMALGIHIDTEGFISADFGKYRIKPEDAFVLQDDVNSPYRSAEWWSEHYVSETEEDNDTVANKAGKYGISLSDRRYKDFTAEQIENILTAIEEHYDRKAKRKIVSVERYIDMDRWQSYEGYEWNETVIFKVMVEDDIGAPRFITIGSTDGWNECRVLNEGY